MGMFDWVSKAVRGIMEGVEDLIMFAAIFIFGMIIFGEFYGLYTFPTVRYQGFKSPFFYPIYLAILLLIVRIVDDLLKRK